MKTEEFKTRLNNACKQILANEETLTQIDSKFGDADHGLTMHKVAQAIQEAVNEAGDSFKDLLDKVAEKVGVLNGGSAIPLWSSLLQGMADVAPESDEADLEKLKEIFANGFEEFDFMSGAKVGDKTIMDALKPAIDAMKEAEDEGSVFTDAAKAAMDGAEATKEFTARYGRAKSYGEKTLGTVDAGALSMACFFKGLAEKE
ncbi:MAG: DAK2 domain-containing protein [Erysipelotrichaceae bacterium]|nr:DAK2 domain-containing protein [Erysipelotrichaceae bacterium]